MEALQSLLSIFSDYGYIAVFAVLLACGFGIPIPEDVSLVAGGVITGLGYGSVHVMVFVGLAGVLCGDSFMFLLGYFFGDRALRFKPIAKILTPERFEKVQQKFSKYGNGLMFFARFLPGMRTAVFVSAGVSRKVGFWRFFLMDGLASLISVPIWVYLGHWGASNLDNLIVWMHRGQTGIMTVVGVVIVVCGVIWLRRSRRKKDN